MEDEAAAALLEQLPEEERFETWWLVERDGTLHSYGDGGLALLGHMHVTRPLARLLRRPRIERALDQLDLVIAGRRSTLGKLLPRGEGPRRYP
jgi:hypothetical protein